MTESARQALIAIITDHLKSPRYIDRSFTFPLSSENNLRFTVDKLIFALLNVGFVSLT